MRLEKKERQTDRQAIIKRKRSKPLRKVKFFYGGFVSIYIILCQLYLTLSPFRNEWKPFDTTPVQRKHIFRRA